MKRFFYLFLLPFILIVGCDDKDEKLKDPEESRLEDKTVSVTWETTLGILFTDLIPNKNSIITRGRIDGADKILVINTEDGNVLSSFNAINFNKDRLFKSKKWLTSSNTNFTTYNVDDGSTETVNLNFNVNNASGIIQDQLYFAGRFGPSENPWDFNFLRYNLSTKETEYLHFACADGINSFRPHFFLVDERSSPINHFYYVYGKDLANPYSLTFAKFSIRTKATKDLFNFGTRGKVTEYILNENKLSFLNYERTEQTTVNLDTDERMTTATFDKAVFLVEGTDYAQRSQEGVLTLYNSQTGKELWSRDYSLLNISSNIATDDTYVYVTGYKTLYVLDITDGEIVYQEELSFLGESTENGLDQTLYCYGNGKLIVKNAKTAFGLRVE